MSACTPPCARPTTAASNACCWRIAAAPPTTATTPRALKMVKMQGGVFGAVADSDGRRAPRCHVIARRRRRAMRSASKRSASTKRFGAFTALDDVSLKVAPATRARAARRERRRQVHAGQMPPGLLPRRRGRVPRRRPRGGRSRNPRDADALGLGMVYQHFTLVPSMTVAENLVMARADVPAVIDWTARARATRRVHGADAVPGAARQPVSAASPPASGRRPKSQAALSAAPLPDPRRADLGADARRRPTRCWAWCATWRASGG